MKGKTWNDIVKPIVVLVAICIVASAALAGVNQVTAPIIAEQQEAAANAAYLAVLPEADGFEEVTDFATTNVQAVLKATNGAGWVIKSSAKGFGGDVPVVVGFDANGAIVGIQFMENSETAGYGQKLVDGSEAGVAFTQQFIGMTEAPVVGTNIDAMTGATVSSKAAASAVTTAINCFNEVALGQDAVIDEGPVTLSPEEVRAMLAPNATLTQIDAPEGLTDGMKVMNGAEAEVRVGNCLPLSEIPVGTQVHNIELYPGKGGQLVRSAGNSAQLMAKEGKYATLRLPSGEMRMVPLVCRATVGVVGNVDHSLVKIGKAGRKRHMGIRPTVRGSVMNPNDHPHGGGEGKTGIGRPGPSTPWGKPALGLKTRKSKKASNKLIVRRRDGRAIK